MLNLLEWAFVPLPIGVVGTLAWIGCRYFYTPIRRRSEVSGTEVQGPRSRQVLDRFRYRWLPVPLVLAALTVAITLHFSDRVHLDPLSGKGMGPRAEVETRLGEEVLTPPPALPPSLFIGTERAGLETADRDWNHLDTGFAQVVLKLFARMAARGYPVALLEGYRSPERQEVLADQGPSVTLARANQSRHQFGLAADVAPLENGHLVFSLQAPWAREAYQALGEEAEGLGLTWGGRWKLRDLGHVESADKGHLRRASASPTES